MGRVGGELRRQLTTCQLIVSFTKHHNPIDQRFSSPQYSNALAPTFHHAPLSEPSRFSLSHLSRFISNSCILKQACFRVYLLLPCWIPLPELNFSEVRNMYCLFSVFSAAFLFSAFARFSAGNRFKIIWIWVALHCLQREYLSPLLISCFRFLTPALKNPQTDHRPPDACRCSFFIIYLKTRLHVSSIFRGEILGVGCHALSLSLFFFFGKSFLGCFSQFSSCSRMFCDFVGVLITFELKCYMIWFRLSYWGDL